MKLEITARESSTRFLFLFYLIFNLLLFIFFHYFPSLSLLWWKIVCQYVCQSENFFSTSDNYFPDATFFFIFFIFLRRLMKSSFYSTFIYLYIHSYISTYIKQNKCWIDLQFLRTGFGGCNAIVKHQERSVDEPWHTTHRNHWQPLVVNPLQQSCVLPLP